MHNIMLHTNRPRKQWLAAAPTKKPVLLPQIRIKQTENEKIKYQQKRAFSLLFLATFLSRNHAHTQTHDFILL